MFRVCHAFLYVHCSLVVTCCEMANLLVLLFVMFSCVFVTLPCGVLGQVGNLIIFMIFAFLLTSLLVHSKLYTIHDIMLLLRDKLIWNFL